MSEIERLREYVRWAAPQLDCSDQSNPLSRCPLDDIDCTNGCVKSILAWAAEPDPQGKQDEPPKVDVPAMLGGYAEQHYKEDHKPLLERIALLEGKANKPQEVILRLPEVLVRDNTTGALMFFTEQATEPPAPAGSAGSASSPQASSPQAEPKVDLDALEDRLIAAFVKDGYDIDGEACDTVRKVFRASRAAAKEASRENL